MERKIFEGEMLIKTQPTTFLQMVFEISRIFYVIVRSIKDPDYIFCKNS